MTELSTSPLSRHLRMIADEVTDAHWAESINAAAEILEQPKHGSGWVERTDEEQIEALNSRVVEVLRQRDALKTALENVLLANAEFRDAMPESWEGDPLQDACDAAHAALAQLKDSANE